MDLVVSLIRLTYARLWPSCEVLALTASVPSVLPTNRKRAVEPEGA